MAAASFVGVFKTRCWFQVKHEIWRQLTNDYLQLTGGLVNVSQKEVMRKWTNMKVNITRKCSAEPRAVFFNLALSRPLFGDLRIRKDLSGLFRTANDILDFLTTENITSIVIL